METCRLNTKKSVDGIRQGNENDEIDVFTYVTEGTFDAYLYQLVENKQRFISQIMTSKSIVRSAEDIDEKALSYAEIKALAAGNPLIIEKTNLDAEVSKLKLLKQSYLSQIYALEDALVKYYPIEIKKNEDLLANVQKDIEIVKENTKIDNEDKFSTMMLKGKQYNKKDEAGKMILEICKNKTDREPEEIGSYKGMKMYLEIVSGDFILDIKNNSSYIVKLGKDVFGNITRIDNALADMEKTVENTKIKLENLNQQYENAKIEVKVPFDKEDELKEKSVRLDRVNALLNLNEKDNVIVEENEEEKTDDEEQKKRDYDKGPIL